MGILNDKEEKNGNCGIKNKISFGRRKTREDWDTYLRIKRNNYPDKLLKKLWFFIISKNKQKYTKKPERYYNFFYLVLKYNK